VSGFWHGANWTFVAWGAINAIYFLPIMLAGKNRLHLDIVAQGKLLPNGKQFFQVLATFLLTCFAWIFFRAANITHAFQIIKSIFSASFFRIPEIIQHPKFMASSILLIIFIIMEWIGREHQYAIEKVAHTWKTPLRYAFYYIIVFAIFWYGGKEQQFIYFQF
jgi:D-alanyl-lipoteichoic acid acyltransferase DltB (MBOAT superfamily)